MASFTPIEFKFDMELLNLNAPTNDKKLCQIDAKSVDDIKSSSQLGRTLVKKTEGLPYFVDMLRQCDYPRHLAKKRRDTQGPPCFPKQDRDGTAGPPGISLPVFDGLAELLGLAPDLAPPSGLACPRGAECSPQGLPAGLLAPRPASRAGKCLKQGNTGSHGTQGPPGLSQQDLAGPADPAGPPGLSAPVFDGLAELLGLAPPHDLAPSPGLYYPKSGTCSLPSLPPGLLAPRPSSKAGNCLKQGDSASEGCNDSDAEDTSVGAGSTAGSGSSDRGETESTNPKVGGSDGSMESDVEDTRAEEFQMRADAPCFIPAKAIGTQREASQQAPLRKPPWAAQAVPLPREMLQPAQPVGEVKVAASVQPARYRNEQRKTHSKKLMGKLAKVQARREEDKKAFSDSKGALD